MRLLKDFAIPSENLIPQKVRVYEVALQGAGSVDDGRRGLGGGDRTGDQGSGAGCRSARQAANGPSDRAEDPSVKTLRGSKRGNTRTFRLTASQFKQRIANFQIKTATVWGYNNSTPGPTLLAYRGERIRVVIDNRLPEPTTVHFHGAGAPNRYDGVAGISQPNPIGVAKRFTYAIPRRARSPETSNSRPPTPVTAVRAFHTTPLERKGAKMGKPSQSRV